MSDEFTMQDAPYKCHVFVCVNDRQGSRKSCADGNSKEIRVQIKKSIKEKGIPKKDVRVSQSLCMGLCGRGPNVIIYPQQKWFSAVTIDDVDKIVSEVENLLQNA